MVSGKLDKIAHVSGHTGSSIWDIEIIILVCTLSLCLNNLWSRISSRRTEMNQYLQEYAILIIPMVLAMTKSEYSRIIISTQITCIVTLVMLPKPKLTQVKQEIAKLAVKFTGHAPYVVAFRSYLQMLTVVAILAVDFEVFPRKFAKCESYGTSLMDVGVGCFVFSSGLVAGPRLQNSGSLRRTLRLVLPVLLLGLARVVFTKALDYQEHVSEYGVHWNFFITLGLLPLLIYIQNRIFKGVPLYLAGITVLGVYQYSLSHGLEEFIMNAPRIDYFTMNREGIFSLIGFYGLFLLAAQSGKEILSISSSSWEKLTSLCKYFVIYSTGLYLCLEVLEMKVSRRMANIPFVIWVLWVCVGFLLVSFILETYLLKSSKQITLFSAVNRNQLLVFLVANVVTGLINMSIDTLAYPDDLALRVILVYAFVVGAIAVLLHSINLTIKL